jgi:hypothetical protein
MVLLVAQIFNLPYRRFEIGRASVGTNASGYEEGSQNANLRNGRLKICATDRARSEQFKMRIQ